MGFPIDHLHDPLRVEFVKIASQYNVPDFVLEATDEQLAAPEGPARNVYALPLRKSLPLTNKAATWLSAAYTMENTDLPQNMKDATLRVLKGAAAVHGIDMPVKKLAPAEPALTDSDYLIQQETKSGKLLRLPVRNKEEAKVAVSYLKEHRHEFSYDVRRQAAQNLLQKSASLNLGLSDTDRRMLDIDAANFVAPEDQLIELVTSRSKIAAHLGLSDYAEGFSKLAKEVKATNGLVVDGDLAGEILEAVKLFDQHTGRKSASLDHVAILTNDQFDKWVDQVCVLKSGHVFDRAGFSKLKVTDVETATGLSSDKIADETGLWIDVEKAASAFSELDLYKANRIARLCELSGVEPNMQIDCSPTLSHNDLLALAGR